MMNIKKFTCILILTGLISGCFSNEKKSEIDSRSIFYAKASLIVSQLGFDTVTLNSETVFDDKVMNLKSQARSVIDTNLLDDNIIKGQKDFVSDVDSVIAEMIDLRAIVATLEKEKYRDDKTYDNFISKYNSLEMKVKAIKTNVNPLINGKINQEKDKNDGRRSKLRAYEERFGLVKKELTSLNGLQDNIALKKKFTKEDKKKLQNKYDELKEKCVYIKKFQVDEKDKNIRVKKEDYLDKLLKSARDKNVHIIGFQSIDSQVNLEEFTRHTDNYFKSDYIIFINLAKVDSVNVYYNLDIAPFIELEGNEVA